MANFCFFVSLKHISLGYIHYKKNVKKFLESSNVEIILIKIDNIFWTQVLKKVQTLKN